ncbi:universal stress protein [Nocardia thailandica]
MSEHTHTEAPVVVGVDGSEQAATALRWAAEYAAEHQAPLELVFVVDIPIDYSPALSQPYWDRDALIRDGRAILADAASDAATLTATTVHTTLAEGPAVPVLRRHSDGARLLVVGSRGMGAFRRTLLGSVSTSLARHAGCPVAVVPEHPYAADGPVVVGVDGSACSAEAVAVAFDEAARRAAPLVAVHAWSEFYRYEPRSTMQTEADTLLSENLAGYGEKYPEVDVRRIAIEDKPARALLDAGIGARLIVVGSHGRGGFTGMALGSVSQAVLHGAECPLIIVRPRTRD